MGSHLLEWLYGMYDLYKMCHITCMLHVYDLSFMWGGEEDACWVTRNKVWAWRQVSAEKKKNGIFSETVNNFQPRWRYRVLILFFLQDPETSLAIMVNETGYFLWEFRTSAAVFVVTESCIYNKTSRQMLAVFINKKNEIFGTCPKHIFKPFPWPSGSSA